MHSKFLQLIVFICTVMFGQFVFAATTFAAEGDLIWAKTINPSASGSYFDIAEAVVTDGTGVYVAGYDSSPGLNAQWRIEKRSLDTGALIWTYTNNFSSAEDRALAIAIDGTGVYVAGFSGSQWRIEKYSLATGALLWTQPRSFVGTYYIQAFAIAVDNTGVYVAGTYGPGAAGVYAARIEKVSTSTGANIWTQVDPVNYTVPYALAVNATGLYVAGDGQGATPWRIQKRSTSNGAIIWEQKIKIIALFDVPTAIAVDNTSVYALGPVDGYDNGEGISYKSWRIEKRTNSDGTMPAGTWAVTTPVYDAPDYKEFGGIAVDSSGVYDVINDHIPGLYEWRIEKRNLSTGSILLTKLSDPSTNSDYACGIAVDGSGTYIVGDDIIPGNFEWRIEKRSKGVCAGPVAISWTDPTITANSTKIRKVHIDELRTAIGQVYVACGQVAPTWTDPTITANSTKIRKVHIDELRSAVSNAQ